MSGMERWMNRVALVTGASVGIGKAISKALVEHGMIVYGCARDVDKIKSHSEELESQSAKGSLRAVKCDLRNEEEILSMFAEIKRNHGGVDVCINNAGLNFRETLLNGDTNHWKNILDVNVLALSICTREAVKQMMERHIDDGHIIHINSTYGRSPSTDPMANFYAATKCMVTALTEGLRRELRELGSHIRVTSISPGTVRDTEITLRASSGDEELVRNKFTSKEALVPKDVADMVVYTLAAPPHMEINDIIVRSIAVKT
ncbi:dehydrogenase/reductase SDR family member 11-like isoform X2 [Ptychodera flava]|uniref:dehydrogenase/reductase SDR family member 11-like isoform X2 n=1 Tax=Ptychodera flava TaxID=63121 RepID=UPI003969F321